MNFKLNARFALLLGLLLLPLMVTNDSLWLDEGDTAMYALQPDLRSWWSYLRHDIAADCQMPLAMFAAWVGGKLVGTAEWQMRTVNILWGAFALVGMYRAGKRLHLPWLPFLLAIQPYFWFYTNEARPYALQIACGAWLFAAFAEFISAEGAGEMWAWLFSGTTFFLCLSTMLAPVPIAGLVVSAGILARVNRWKISRRAVLILLTGALANVPIAIYYASTLARGAKGAQLWHVDPKIFGYIVYEFTGMSGLGLAVEKIRELARSPRLARAIAENFAYFALPGVAFMSLLVLLGLGLRQRDGNTRRGLVFGCAIVLGMVSLIFVSVGIVIQKAFWARHFAPVFPFYVALLGVAVSHVYQQRGAIARWLPLIVCSLLVLSSLNLRFAERHRKENYRDAAHIAQQALSEKKSVWWIAGFLPAQYYGLNYTLSEPEVGKIFCPQFEGRYEGVPAPDVIVYYTKPDIFDANGTVQNLIRKEGYVVSQTLKSFVIYTRSKPLDAQKD